MLTVKLLLLGLATAYAPPQPISFLRTLCALEFGKKQKKQACVRYAERWPESLLWSFTFLRDKRLLLSEVLLKNWSHQVPRMLGWSVKSLPVGAKQKQVWELTFVSPVLGRQRRPILFDELSASERWPK